MEHVDAARMPRYSWLFELVGLGPRIGGARAQGNVRRRSPAKALESLGVWCTIRSLGQRPAALTLTVTVRLLRVTHPVQAQNLRLLRKAWSVFDERAASASACAHQRRRIGPMSSAARCRHRGDRPAEIRSWATGGIAHQCDSRGVRSQLLLRRRALNVRSSPAGVIVGLTCSRVM